MKKRFVISLSLFLLSSSVLPAVAATTVTVDDNSKVTVEQNQPASEAQTTAQRPVVVVPNEPVVVAATVEDPRNVEGEIIKVDYPGNQITVEDIYGRQKRVTLKQGMIGSYKVGDYVKIYLMADLREAKTIETRHTADLDGDIVRIDAANNQITVREANGNESVVWVRPNLIQSYKAGDKVRLYVVSEYPDLHEAKMIRVR